MEPFIPLLWTALWVLAGIAGVSLIIGVAWMIYVMRTFNKMSPTPERSRRWRD